MTLLRRGLNCGTRTLGYKVQCLSEPKPAGRVTHFNRKAERKVRSAFLLNKLN